MNCDLRHLSAVSFVIAYTSIVSASENELVAITNAAGMGLGVGAKFTSCMPVTSEMMSSLGGGALLFTKNISSAQDLICTGITSSLICAIFIKPVHIRIDNRLHRRFRLSESSQFF